MTSNIQIDRSFCKESHLRTKYAVFLYICLRWSLFQQPGIQIETKYRFREYKMQCSNWAALGTKDHCFFQSLILNEIYWVVVGYFFSSLYSVAILVFYEYVLGVGGHRNLCSPCKGNHSNQPVTLSKKQKGGGNKQSWSK